MKVLVLSTKERTYLINCLLSLLNSTKTDGPEATLGNIHRLKKENFDDAEFYEETSILQKLRRKR